MALYVLWQCWQRLVGKPWRIKLGESRKIRLYPHSVVAAFVLYYRIPDYQEMSFIRAYLRTDDLFVDVGANVGVYSLWATETEGVHVIAFEPSTVTHTRAVENVRLNGLERRVKVLRKAVGADHVQVSFSKGLDAINRVVESESGSAEAVQQTTLDRELGSRAPALIKIDVEGQEVDVLRGGRSVITRHRPALIVEVNDPEALRTTFDELGYRTWSYDPISQRLSPAALIPHTNVIALAIDAGTASRIGTGIGDEKCLTLTF